MTRMKRLAVFAMLAGVACRHTLPPTTVPQTSAPAAPAAAPAQWLPLIGEYDTPLGMRLVLEDSGSLWFADTVRHATRIYEQTETTFGIDPAAAARLLGKRGDRVLFVRPTVDRAEEAIIGDAHFARRAIEPAAGTNQLRVTPVRPVEELRVEALRASPPHEDGQFRAPNLGELTRLDQSIRLEIRYATTNNFLGTRFYDQARAFMQRPAAEALVRAHQSLRALGFGLLIHDAYRPWYVTKMFWDATPLEKRWLVADPSQGSRHNRGEAVDLTLYDLRTGAPVEMPSTYDESTDRAFANYPGGTSLQRWRRAVLRRAMEAQGFTVNPNEWWHFDYKDWREYPIGNVPFNRLGS
jgi:D-alanyl-D-alanine dipeptidase